MDTKTAAQSGDKKKSSRLPPLRGWFVLIVLLALAAIYLYTLNLQKREFFLNSFHFRTLQEVSSAFNNKLEQLVNLHEYGESEATISAIFPSYKKGAPQSSVEVRTSGSGVSRDHDYILEAGRLRITRRADGSRSSVDIVDVLPEPTEGFALYLIVDDQNNVLSSTSAASGLSMIDARAVSRAVQLRESEDWVQLARQAPSVPTDGDKPLPGHSTHIDMELNTGNSRVFILPFLLHHDIGIPRREAKSSDDSRSNVDSAGVPLYLLGVQPQQAIEEYENSRWNMSLLLLSLVFLIAVWLGTRLLMLSRHQPIGTYFYRATIVVSYLTFLLLVALLLAFAQREAAVAERQSLAREAMMQLESAMDADLYAIVDALKPYHGTYQDLLALEVPGSAEGPATPPAQGNVVPECADPAAGESWTLLHRIPDSTGRLGQCPVEDIVEFLSGAGRKRIGKATAPVSEDSDELPLFSEVNVYPRQATVSLSDGGETPAEWFELSEVDALPGSGRLLSVFLMNEHAWQIMPGFFFYETNKAPISYHLSHRHYFRRVRDQEAWEVDLHGPCPRDARSTGANATGGGDGGNCAGESMTVRSLYLQRLLNINTGTRGTTLGMPLEPVAAGRAKAASQPRYILGADIEIPSLSFTPWAQPETLQDLIPMVVDRQSGQVLYHMDADRSMVENLYQTGRGTADIARLIQSERPVRRAVSGHYHGAPGKFLSGELPVSAWAVVVFIPDASTVSLMTNAFLANAGGMLSLLLLLATLLWLWERFSRARARESTRRVRLDSKGLLEFGAVLIAGTYLAFRLGDVLERYGAVPQAITVCVPLALLAALLWVKRELARARRASAQEEQPPERGLPPALLPLLLAGLGAWAYLAHVGDASEEALDWYFDSLFEARLNQERKELHDIALTRFPNTVRDHGAEPLTLLPLNSSWRDALSSRCIALPSGILRDRNRHATPDDIGTFSQYTASTNAYDWVLRYLLGVAPAPAAGGCETLSEPPALKDVGPGATSGGRPVSAPALARFSAVTIGAFVLLCALWYRVHEGVVTARLTGSMGLLEHLRYIITRNMPAPAYAPRRDLVLDVQCRHYAGESLAALLNRHKRHVATDDELSQRDGAGSDPDPGITLLLEECPWLWSRGGVAENLRGLHIAFERTAPARTAGGAEEGTSAPLEVHLSKLDTCLSRAASREELLRFLQALKILCLRDRLAVLRVSLDFHSYESLLLKAHSTRSDRDALTAAEFADWADIFLDFSVDLPQELVSEIDIDFLAHECAGSHLFDGLIDEVAGSSLRPDPGGRRRMRWLSLKDVSKTAGEWATINFILLKAGALLRHKWESCSGAEKLAIYQLARGRRINMANGQLLEQLALQGLIRIDGDRVRIVSNSLAYFARHAEDTEALRELVEIGESGVWQQYRVPVTLVILITLAAIALTSGSSLYLITASLLGLLGTIGSLTSSAQLIRENLR